MKVSELALSGVKLMEPRVFEDPRGFFTERYNRAAFESVGFKTLFVQDNFSRSKKGVLRGLHFQFDQPQSKLVTCLRGRIFDVAVDIRKNSPTFGKSVTIELDGARPQWLWVPAGFAHGFCAISDEDADVMYKVDCPYNPAGEAGLLWNDAHLNISWPMKEPLLSPKDEILLSWEQYSANPKF